MGLIVSWIKRHLEGYTTYRLAREVKWCIKNYLKESRSIDRMVISLHPDSGRPSRGNVLLCYIIDAFLLENKQAVHYHTNIWESVQIAKTFLDLGYSVDVIHFTNTTFTPEKNYAFFIDPRQNLERIAPLLNKDCVKILHIDIAQVLYHDFAEVRRLFELQQRRGVTLRPDRFEIPNQAIEYADCAICLGNEFTVNTYRYAKKPIYRVPISTPTVYPWFEEKDFDTCRKNFLWLNNHGLVHKGLDLILEAFSEMPDYHLTVCGPVEQEKDFVHFFHSELFETPNIHTIGWIDITSERFLEIIKNNVGIISASCSEAGGGSVITGMHAGLIPIANYESSVDMNDDYGILLEDCSIGKIRESIKRISALPASEIKGMARRAWEFSRKYHTRERFAEEYRKTIVEIIKTSQM